MDSRLVRDVKQSEGCKLAAYRDSLGFWTIGYGHLVDNKGLPGVLICTQAQADLWLEEDLSQAEKRCMHLIEWPMVDTPCRQNAVIELEFNMAGKWVKFYKTRLAIGNKDWKGAHDGLLNSLWAKQVGETRSNRIANYLLNGEYPT